MGKLKLQAKFSRKEKSCFFHFGGSRKTPYRKPLATAPDLFRKCGQRNATLEITRLAGDIGGGSSTDKRVAARDEFPGMKLRISSPTSVSKLHWAGRFPAARIFEKCFLNPSWTVPTIARYDTTTRFVSPFKLSTLAR
ncbi:PREDICTED: uncharacterized protein LOC105151382 [Acromyrmex echinatior]|uniref:uncharacterized protein LOC105151382 n=1 Tax=Acromyrmex echinatior TaxID=103372 RepID=UPI000580CA65|nr:PREDICTED: uncharacterized protein LOC105151382 [Acromyrmex echinatior]